MSEKITIWHYPQCSKSRKTLAILRDQEADIQVRHYLDDPPDRKTLIEVLTTLEIPARELVRTGEQIFKDLEVDEANLTDSDWLDLLIEHPKLIQRPVVITDTAAVIGRPPEKVYEILSSPAKK